MDRAHDTARAEGWSREPIVEILIPSTVDDSLAPPGKHVASLFCQHFRYTLPDGRSWEDERERAADAVIEQVTRFAPNFKSAVLGRRVLTPFDLEREFGLVGGDIFHGKLSLNQLFSARPVLGHGDYRMPLAGPLPLRGGRASGRRGDRRAGPQRGARDPARRAGGPLPDATRFQRGLRLSKKASTPSRAISRIHVAGDGARCVVVGAHQRLPPAGGRTAPCPGRAPRAAWT